MQTDTRAEAAQDRSDQPSFLKRIRDMIQRRRTYSATVRRLRNLPESELDAMGISRGMITRVAFETAYGDRK